MTDAIRQAVDLYGGAVSLVPGGIELKSPRDISVDGSGRIYIADRDLKAFLVIE